MGDPYRPEDLAGLEHWDRVYANRRPAGEAWGPKDYEELALASRLLSEIVRCEPSSILEAGCGDSCWLPYLAAQAGIKRVSGVDYSERGVEMARTRLRAAGVSGQVVRVDLLNEGDAGIAPADFVYSLGLVEHFADTVAVLRALRRFVARDGVLFTEIPNLRSLHGVLSWLWQPVNLRRHVLLGLEDLECAYRSAGFSDLRSGTCGVLSLGIVSWEFPERFPRVCRRLVRPIRKVQRRLDATLNRMGFDGGNPATAPYLWVSGKMTG